MTNVPSWTYEFHGHHCPFMPIGYRMGQLALRTLGVEREPDHGLFAFPEIGAGHPMTCMADGIQAATGCTYGKLLMEKSGIGKLAFTLFKPGKGAVRVAMKPDFIFQPVKGSFNKAKCVKCGEYVFERYVREKDGKPHCIPCSGYAG